MTTLFIVCLGVGAGVVIISLLLGQVGGAFDADFGGPFKPLVIALFLTVFGGMGLIFMPMFAYYWIAIVLAGVAGIFAAGIVFRFVMIPLQRRENTTAHEKQSLIGVCGKVSEAIPAGGHGKITYTFGDKIMSGPAKSKDGGAVERGTEVEIVYIERNTYVVCKQKNINKEVV